ncbi:MAG: hypothetical protein CL624_04755 [Arcobacter sp.]|nr:hypothetical protein [Arcobacter sp.]|tara:strand:+ start:14032 stop:15246 length:1215 start_codon:yes stop_codon:yes gene_type:complete
MSEYLSITNNKILSLFSKKIVLNILVVFSTFFSLYISFLITNNNFRDNINYSTAYLIFESYISKNNKKYYLLNANNIKINKNQVLSKYCLIPKKNILREDANILLNDKYYLVSEKNCVKKDYLGVKNIHKKYYLSNTLSLKESYKNYFYAVGSYEVGDYILNYIFSKFISYDLYILLLNIFFLVTVYIALKRFTKHYKIIYTILLFTDFYFYVYLSELHRLKLSIIFFLIFMLVKNISRGIFLILGLISHLQSVVFYAYIIILGLYKDLLSRKIFYCVKKYLPYFVFLIIIFILFQDQIFSKLNYYQKFEIPFKTIIFSGGYLSFLFYFKDKEVLPSFLPLSILVFIASFLVGENRLFFILIEFVLIYELNKVFNKNYTSLIIVIPIIVYNSYKSINYIMLGLS